VTASKDPDTEGSSRRQVLARIGAAILAITVDSAWGPISPAEARAKAVPFRHLTSAEARELESFADTLLPGAAQEGVAHYIDDQLGRVESLLILRYMDYGGEFLDFYRQGLQSLDRECRARFGKSFSEAAEEQKTAFVRDISARNPEGWAGPPAPLIFFVVRNDAADVYYGTPAGFERLGVPYQAMNPPPRAL
jgi:hypothetical protein